MKMKLVIAIVNYDDANPVTQNLARAGFSSTRLATTGGFLRTGNVTLLVGVTEDKVDEVIQMIHTHAHSRTQMVPAASDVSQGFFPALPVEVTVGGSTVFVVDVDRFERV